MAKRSARKPAAAEVAHIHESYRALAVPIDQPTLDPRNANQHSEDGLALIGNSVSEFQQLIPIIVNRETGIVLKGNGTLKAMRARGFKQVAAVYVDLDGTAATKFSIVDNQAGRLSDWDTRQLDELLQELAQDDIGHADLGFSDAEIAQLLAEAGSPARDVTVAPHEEQEAPDQTGELKDKFEIVVYCKDEEHQIELLNQLGELGMRCKALIG